MRGVLLSIGYDTESRIYDANPGGAWPPLEIFCKESRPVRTT
jgi:hypothetical protein